jgi:hypothetical protein
MVYNQVKSLVRVRYRDCQMKSASKTMLLAKGKPFKVGDRVWLYAPGVRLENKKLAHTWVGPYRIKEIDVDQPHYYVLDVVSKDKTFPKVHFDRLKLCIDQFDRPKEKLINPNLPEIEFDEELLPQDSFDSFDGFSGVSALLNYRWARRSKRSRPEVEYKVLWEDGSESWVRECDLQCPSLLEEFIREHGRICPSSL